MPNTKNIDKYDELTQKISRPKAIYFTEYLGLNVNGPFKPIHYRY